MMWEWLGWLAAGCLALVMVGVTVTLVVGMVRQIIHPPAPRKPKDGDRVEIFKGGPR